MFERYNRIARVNRIFDALGWESQGVYFTRPEIARNGEQVWVFEKRLEGGGQIPILSGRKKADRKS